MVHGLQIMCGRQLALRRIIMFLNCSVSFLQHALLLISVDLVYVPGARPIATRIVDSNSIPVLRKASTTSGVSGNIRVLPATTIE